MDKRERASITLILQPINGLEDLPTGRYHYTIVLPDTCYKSGTVAREDLLDRIDASIAEYEMQRDRK